MAKPNALGTLESGNRAAQAKAQQNLAHPPNTVSASQLQKPFSVSSDSNLSKARTILPPPKADSTKTTYQLTQTPVNYIKNIAIA